MLALTVAYVALIRWGPPLMGQRKALQLRGPIMLYDVLQVTLNTALLLHVRVYIYIPSCLIT